MLAPQGRAALACVLAADKPVEGRCVQEALPAVPGSLRLQVVPEGDQAVASLQRPGAAGGAPRADLGMLAPSLPQRRGADVVAVLQEEPVLQTIVVVVALEVAAERVLGWRQGCPAAHYRLKPLGARPLVWACRLSPPGRGP
jgi:hypothetical protein